MEDYRIETDSLGSVKVPNDALWGAQTQRAIENFPISGITFPPIFLESLVRLKRALAKANKDLGELGPKIADGIIQAATEILEKQMWDQFPLDIFQTGSGTQTNMNANEVIANLASELLGGERGKKAPVHPNDHVNRGQSSNDVIPSAMYISATLAVKDQLLPAIKVLEHELEEKAKEYIEIIKIGRTHLQDAVPISLGQEFSAYAAQLRTIQENLEALIPLLCELPIGGTAVGTGLNAHPQLAEKTCQYLKEELQLPFAPTKNRFADIAAHDKMVTLSGLIRTLAIALIKIANDIRLLGSGPRCGIGELILPANEPGSSIMPGKVNPTQAEMLVQVCMRVIGNDHAVAIGGFFGGQFDLNTAKPLIAYNVLESITLLRNAMLSFNNRCVKGIVPNKERIRFLVEQSLMLATALNPYIGYDNAARIAKKAFKEGKTIREVALEEKVLSPEELDTALNLRRMVFPDK